jgi:cytochrome c
MDTLKGNKIFAAMIIALLLGIISSMIADILIEPQTLSKPAVHIEVSEEAPTDVGAIKQEEGPGDISSLLDSASPEEGKAIAKKCAQCHNFVQGAGVKIGPDLWNIVGAKQSNNAEFIYSEAFKKLTGIWDPQALNEFIYKPRAYAPGTKMSFAGLSSSKDRAALIAYLKTLR